MAMAGTIDKELQSLNGERMMSRVAVQGYQSQIADKLRGAMGDDMMKVLNGERVVKLTKWQKFKYKIDNFLKRLTNIEDKTDGESL